MDSWKSIWKYGLYYYHHFHSGSHEVLGITHGADVLFGGEGGKNLTLEAGDVVVLPAGTGLNASDNLVVIGAYPESITISVVINRIVW